MSILDPERSHQAAPSTTVKSADGAMSFQHSFVLRFAPRFHLTYSWRDAVDARGISQK